MWEIFVLVMIGLAHIWYNHKKKLFIIMVMIGLSISQCSEANEEIPIRMTGEPIETMTICIEGYKFIVINKGNKMFVLQLLVPSGGITSIPIPIKCRQKE